MKTVIQSIHKDRNNNYLMQSKLCKTVLLLLGKNNIQVFLSF